MVHSQMIAAGRNPQLIDIGANLTHESFQPDFAAVMQRAADSAVQRLIVTGTSIEATRAAIHLHRHWPDRLFATCGIHPHHAADLDDAAHETLRELSAAAGVVAIGECGLDYYRNYAPREAQIAAFRRQLELAVQVGKPVFLHQRDAHADFAAILREYRPALAGGVAHCFTGHAAELEECLQMDLAIGITGWICDERRGRHLLPLMPHIPRGSLMIETDAPYLLPRSLKPAPRSRRNEPAFLPEVARMVAEARKESFEELAAHTTAAAQDLFGLPAPAG
ncbi:MAG: TatD family hydrolase [Steroidobacteraceae bacterium]